MPIIEQPNHEWRIRRSALHPAETRRLAPDSDRIAVGAQRRDPEQRELVVDYTVRSEAFASSSAWKCASIAGLLLVTILWLLRVWCRPACPRFDRLDPRRA